MTDERVIGLVVEQATARLENQFRDVDALDVKALGVLGADAAALGVLVATHDSLNNLWWLPTCGLAVSGLLLLLCVWPRALDEGPNLRTFFETFGGQPYPEVALQMLGELLAAVEGNELRAPPKGRVFKAGFATLVVSLAGAFLVALLR
jgi:hypothetical protein